MSASAPRRAPPGGAGSTRAIGICASTGGPGVLVEILAGLPADFAPPVLVVQHIATGFLEGLVTLLASRIELPVAIARDGMPLRAGVWLAPDGVHLTVTGGGRIALDRSTVAGRHRPSADLLLESMAAAFGPAAVAVVLTGMGRDGAKGAAAVGAHGGVVLAQDEATSRIYSMPEAAVAAGAQALSPARIAVTLRELGPLAR